MATQVWRVFDRPIIDRTTVSRQGVIGGDWKGEKVVKVGAPGGQCRGQARVNRGQGARMQFGRAVERLRQGEEGIEGVRIRKIALRDRGRGLRRGQGVRQVAGLWLHLGSTVWFAAGTFGHNILTDRAPSAASGAGRFLFGASDLGQPAGTTAVTQSVESTCPTGRRWGPHPIPFENKMAGRIREDLDDRLVDHCKQVRMVEYHIRL